MKFEIDDKTGMIEDETTLDFIPTETTSGDNPISHYLITSHQLEAILQAVKKTQEKLVNKQIQDIQDSKNMIISQPKFEINGDNIDLEGENVSIQPTDPKQNAHLTINCMVDHGKIEQNQKIVDGVITLWESCQKMMDSYQEQIDNIKTNGLNESFLKEELEKQLFVRRDLEDMVGFRTGKDIKDL